MPGPRYIVSVEDRLSEQMTGHAGAAYESPPHLLEHAHELVRVLLDSPGRAIEGEGPWRRARAGGERVVWLTLADQLFV